MRTRPGRRDLSWTTSRANPSRMTATIRTAEGPRPEEPSDVELLQRTSDGDEVAFGTLAARLGPRLKRVLFRLGLGEDEAEDVAQETLVRVWKGSAGFKGGSSVSTWACSIAVNQGISLLRRRRIAPLPHPELVADPEADWEGRERARAVRQAVLELPLKLR